MKKLFLILLSFPSMFCAAQSPVINTICGNGTAGYFGDSGPCNDAEINYLHGISTDSNGNYYLGDQDNNRVRIINSAGIITTIAGTGTAGFNGDGIPATDAEINGPSRGVIDRSGNFIFTDDYNNRVRIISKTGTITTLAGTGSIGSLGDGGPSTAAVLYNPADIAIDTTGNIYIADLQNNKIRKISAGTGIITTVAGNGGLGYSGDGGPAINAMFYKPNFITINSNQELVITDNGNHRIRKVDASGIVTTIAGTGISGYYGNGIPATNAQLNFPAGIAYDGYGNLFIADYANNRIRYIDPTGNIHDFAGTGVMGFSGDGGPATAAAFSHPVDVSFDDTGHLLIIDYNNQRIRKISGITLKVSNVEAESAFTIFPDPVGSILQVEGLNTMADYHVLSLAGQVLLSGKLTNSSKEIEVTRLLQGTYILILHSESGDIKRTTFIKE